MRKPVSRRRFVGGVATALGALGLRPEGDLFAQGGQGRRNAQPTSDEYDAFAKLANNENNYGPPKSVMDAMTSVWRYSNRYGYPDGGIVQAIAAHHGVKPENVLLGAGSGEILQVVGLTYLHGNKKVVGCDPTYATVYQTASGIKAEAIKIPLNKDYSQNIPAMIEAANKNASSVGLFYLVNPNNPTGMIIPAKDVDLAVKSVPKDMPILIDEAYHHFVESPEYATSVPYVLEGRPVIVARTFSKIAALAGMRLGYAIAPAEVIQKMRAYSISSINALVKHGGVASLKDTAGQADMKAKINGTKKKYVQMLEAHGYPVIPSDANFFMVSLGGREVQPVIEEFRAKGVLVGRPFPPMTQHLRVSVGLPEEMDRFIQGFKEIFPQKKASTMAGQQ
ncbi:MAG: aminotransferase class I/II-fold pyridoxal phosphate-dependent enzyme [Vicinamibacterales bacterium]